MALPALSRLYRRLGRRYPYVFLTIELQSAFAVTAATLALFSFYYNASTADYLRIVVVALALTGAAVAITLIRTFPLMRPIHSWLGGSRDSDSTTRAWAAAVALPLNLIRRDMWVPIGIAIIPTCIWAVAVLDLDWPAFFPLFAGSLVALGYSAILHYLILEAGMRPVLLDINAGEEGAEVEVSILFCDVRDFTSFAAQADAKEVVMRLNALFAVVVPIVNRHGGHVDKFVGDGLLAMFGAPEPFPDHADRAVRAACE